jgi:hypothetical protein
MSDRALRNALEAEEADLAEAGVKIGQDVDGLRHLGEAHSRPRRTGCG